MYWHAFVMYFVLICNQLLHCSCVANAFQSVIIRYKLGLIYKLEHNNANIMFV